MPSCFTVIECVASLPCFFKKYKSSTNSFASSELPRVQSLSVESMASKLTSVVLLEPKTFLQTTSPNLLVCVIHCSKNSLRYSSSASLIILKSSLSLRFKKSKFVVIELFYNTYTQKSYHTNTVQKVKEIKNVLQNVIINICSAISFNKFFLNK